MAVGNGDFETPGIGAGEADEWNFETNCDAVMTDSSFCTAGVNGEPQVVVSLASKSVINLDGDDFYIKKTGTDVWHSVLTMRDSANSPIWRLHIRAEAIASGTLRTWQQDDTPMVIDRLGNAYISFQTGDVSNASGGFTDYTIGIVGAAGKTTLTGRLQSAAGIADVKSLILKITPTGEVAWVSRCASFSDSTYSGEMYYTTAQGLTLIDDNTLGVVVSKNSSGSGNVAGATDTITFMPDTDGSKSTVFNRPGGAFFMRINTVNGVLYEQPEELQDYEYTDPVYFYTWTRRHGLAFTDSGKCAWPYETNTNRWNSDYSGHIYRAGSQATSPVVGDAPSPGYPTNMRWETFPVGENAENPQAVVLMREGMLGNPRYVVAASPEVGGTGSGHVKRGLDGGVAAIPGGDDILWGYSNVYQSTPIVGFNTKLRSDRKEQGSWVYNIVDVPGQFYCDVVRLNDNPSTPTNPVVSWITRFDTRAGGLATEWWKGGPKISPVDDVWTVANQELTNNNTIPVFRRIEPSVIDPLGLLDLAKKYGLNYGAVGIYAAKVSDGTPRWYQSIELGQPSGAIDIPGHAARRGREFWYPFYYKGTVAFDPNGPHELEIVSVDSLNHYGYVRYDITTGAFKGWHEIGVGNELPVGPYGWREGYCDVQADIPSAIIAIGVPFTSATPVVTDATGTVTWSISEGSLAGSGLSLNTGTGVVSGTPISTGPYKLVLKAQDSAQDFSYTNRFTLAADPGVGAYPNFTETVGIAMTPFTPTGGGSDFRIVVGTLPDGISLNTSTGEISGTATEDSLFEGNFGEHIGIVIRVDGVVDRTFNFTVQGVALPTPIYYWDGDNTHDEEITPIVASTVKGTKTYVTGTIAQAMEFKATADVFSYGTNRLLIGTGDFTVSMHVNPSAIGANSLFGEYTDANNGTHIRDNLFFIAGTGGGYYTLGFSLTANRWQSLVCTRGGGQIEAWVNSLSAGTAGEAAGDLNGTNPTLHLGRCRSGVDPDANADMDEVAFWRVKLTSGQVKTIEWLRLKGQTLKSFIGF